MVIDIETLKKSYQAAVAYHNRAYQFKEEGQRHSLIFNVGSVALESYLVALCELNGDPPANHDFVMLTKMVESHMAIPEELGKAICSLNDIFGICSIKNYHHGTPEAEDAEFVLKLCDEVSGLFNQEKLKWLFRQERNGPFLTVN